MRILIGTFCVACAYLLPALANAFLLRRHHRSWWRARPVRPALAALTLAGLGTGLVWFASFGTRPELAGRVGEAAFAALLLQGCLAATLVLASTPALLRRILRRPRTTTQEMDPRRRRLLQAGLAAVPLLTAGTSVAGVAGAVGGPRIRPLTLAIPDLHPDLDGFTILQVSDLHLAAFVTLEDLERLLARAAGRRVDLLAVTGDLADDVRQVPRAAALLAAFPAAHGAWAVLGNHEYGNGARHFLAAYAAAGVRLLRDEAVDLPVGGAVLRLGGVDDPVRVPWSRRGAAFFVPRLRALFGGEAPADFRLLLSHRPDALSYAEAGPIDLILAGHTHGGQLGWAGRSLLPPTWRHPFPWGWYRHGAARLYTTSGAGHWFPFRLGCPTEVPLVELRRAP